MTKLVKSRTLDVALRWIIGLLLVGVILLAGVHWN